MGDLEVQVNFLEKLRKRVVDKKVRVENMQSKFDQKSRELEYLMDQLNSLNSTGSIKV